MCSGPTRQDRKFSSPSATINPLTLDRLHDIHRSVLSKKGQTIINTLVFQGKLGLVENLSFFAQLIRRHASKPQNQPYDVIPKDLYFGLRSAFGAVK